jgi:hypothetical protein
VSVCGLTFELTGPRRQAPEARAEMMHHVPQLGLTALAVAGPVERVVRPRPHRIAAYGRYLEAGVTGHAEVSGNATGRNANSSGM